MKHFLNIVTIISAIVMITCILLQVRGVGLGTAFGGEGNVYRSRRGAEQLIFQTTIVAAVLFALSVVLGILAKS